MLFVIIVLLLLVLIMAIKVYGVSQLVILRGFLLFVGWLNVVASALLPILMQSRDLFDDLPSDIKDIVILIIKMIYPYLSIIFLITGLVHIFMANHVKVTIELKESIGTLKTN